MPKMGTPRATGPGFRSKALRFTGAAATGLETYEKAQQERSALKAAEVEKTRMADQQTLMSDRMGKYAQAIQAKDQATTDRIFGEIMNDPQVDDEGKVNFQKYHQTVQQKLKNPPHESGMTQAEYAKFQQDNYKMGRTAEYNTTTRTFDFRQLRED